MDAAKSGIEPSSVVELARHVKHHCPNLVFSGLMTIGMPDYTSTPENFRVFYYLIGYLFYVFSGYSYKFYLPRFILFPINRDRHFQTVELMYARHLEWLRINLNCPWACLVTSS